MDQSTDFDWHRKGNFAVKDPNGEVLRDTFEESGYSAKSTFVRVYNTRWSKAVERGYKIVEFKEVTTLTS